MVSLVNSSFENNIVFSKCKKINYKLYLKYYKLFYKIEGGVFYIDSSKILIDIYM